MLPHRLSFFIHPISDTADCQQHHYDPESDGALIACLWRCFCIGGFCITGRCRRWCLCIFSGICCLAVLAVILCQISCLILIVLCRVSRLILVILCCVSCLVLSVLACISRLVLIIRRGIRLICIGNCRVTISASAGAAIIYRRVGLAIIRFFCRWIWLAIIRFFCRRVGLTVIRLFCRWIVQRHHVR